MQASTPDHTGGCRPGEMIAAPANSNGAGDMRTPLLCADDPAAVSILNAAGTRPLLLVCEHAAAVVPRALDTLGLPPEMFERHIAVDIGAGAVTQALAQRLEARAVMAGFSRLVIDLNRYPDEPSAMPVVSDGVDIPGNHSLDDAARRLRVDALFAPFHSAVARCLAELDGDETQAALVTIHSFTPVMNGVERPWHVGLLWNDDPRLPLPLLDRLAAQPELVVGDNQPYSARKPVPEGSPNCYTTDAHGEAAGRPWVAVEIRQDLIDTPAGVARMASIIGDALDALLPDAGTTCSGQPDKGGA